MVNGRFRFTEFRTGKNKIAKVNDMAETIRKTSGNLRIRDIAELAGVSTAAVSAVLNNRRKTSDATRQRVLDIIDKYNYVPQSAARTLSGKRTFQIGFLLSCKVTLGLANNYFATILSGVHDICRSRNYHLVISTYDLSSINDFIMPANIQQRNVDGLVLAGITDLAVIRELQATDVPFVIVGGHYPEDVLCINNDEKKTTEEIISFFYNLGHRRLAFPAYYEVTERIYLEAWERLLKRFNWQDLILEFPHFTRAEFDEGELLADRWFETDPERRFTALIADDQFCAGFLGRFIGHGGRCPEEISVLASETPLSRYGVIPMSTVDYHNFAMGKQAGSCLIDLVEGKRTFQEISENLQWYRNTTEIIVRNSTGPLLKK